MFIPRAQLLHLGVRTGGAPLGAPSAGLGATWGSSQQCRLGRTEPGDPAYNDGYDDAFSASVIWHALDRATDSASGVESEPSSVASLEAKARDHADATRSAASRSGESGGGGSGLGSSGATANASQFGSCVLLPAWPRLRLLL